MTEHNMLSVVAVDQTVIGLQLQTRVSFGFNATQYQDK